MPDVGPNRQELLHDNVLDDEYDWVPGQPAVVGVFLMTETMRVGFAVRSAPTPQAPVRP